MLTRSGRVSKRKVDTSFLDSSVALAPPRKAKRNTFVSQDQSKDMAANAAMNKKLDSILNGLGDLTVQVKLQEQRIDILTGGHIEVDDSEDDIDEEMGDENENEVLEVPVPTPAASNFPTQSKDKGKGGRGKTSNPRKNSGGRGPRTNNQVRVQNQGAAQIGGRSQQQHQPRGGQSGRGRGRGAGQHMSQSFRAELKRMMKQEILDEQYQAERASRQLIIYGEPSGEDDSKEMEKQRAFTKLKTIMTDMRAEDIESTQRFENHHTDGAFPMIVTIKRKLVVSRILDYMEAGNADAYPWLDQSRTREVRRRNARIVSSIEDLNDKLSKANSATLWENISAGPLSARRRIPNPNYIPAKPLTQAQLTSTNKRPKTSKTSSLGVPGSSRS